MVLTVATLFYLAATRGLYFFPTSVALGPCLSDWTSPSTYIGFFEPLASPMKTVRFSVGEARIQICYGQPSAKGRALFSPGTSLISSAQESDSTVSPPARVLVPDNRLWRMGANEPTRIFLDAPVMLADLRLDRGRYAMYAVPGPDQWEIFVTASTFHWGNQISENVRSREVGSFLASVERAESFQEHFTVLVRPDPGNAERIVLAWGNSEVHIRVEAISRH